MTKVSLYTKTKYYFTAVVIFGFILIDLIMMQYIAAKPLSLLYSLVPFCGIPMILFGIFKKEFDFKSKYNLCLLAFLFFAGVSVLINYKYSLVSNIKALVWMSVQIIVFFGCNSDTPLDWMIKKINLLLKILTATWSALCFISCIFYVIQYGASLTVVGFADPSVRFGFYESRLFGMFHDPNYASVASLVFLIISVFFLCRKSAKRKTKIHYGFCILINLFYIILSGSRTALVCMVVSGLVFGVYFSVLAIKKKHLKTVVAVLTSIGICVALSCGIVGVYYATKTVLSYVPVLYQDVTGNSPLQLDLINNPELTLTGKIADNDSNTNGDNATTDITANEEKQKSTASDAQKKVSDKSDSENTEKLNHDSILERNDVENKDDITNNRFSIWKDALKIWQTTPLFGATSRGYLDYAQEKLGNIYIVEQQYSVHNGFLAVLVYSGILGFLPILAFFILLVVNIIRYLYKNIENQDDSYLSVLFLSACILAIMTASFFLIGMFYCNIYTDFIFWLFAGWIVYFMSQKTKNTKMKDVSGGELQV